MSLPAGFRYAATYAGIRKVAKDDLALIVSDTPASAAAVFTKNLVVAAPVELARRNLQVSRGRVRALLINAGNANCATRTGERVALECVRSVAKTLGVQEQEVLPASTGVIGVEMNARLVVDTMPELAAALRPDSFDAVAAAIMTTDTRAKTAFARDEARDDGGHGERLGHDSAAHGDDAGVRDDGRGRVAGGAAGGAEEGDRRCRSTAYRWMGTRRPTTSSR